MTHTKPAEFKSLTIVIANCRDPDLAVEALKEVNVLRDAYETLKAENEKLKTENINLYSDLNLAGDSVKELILKRDKLTERIKALRLALGKIRNTKFDMEYPESYIKKMAHDGLNEDDKASEKDGE